MPASSRAESPLRRCRAVLFDLDGTLVDTAPDFAACLNLLLAAENRPPATLAEVRPLVSNGSLAIIAFAFGYSPDDPRFEPLRQRFLAFYLANIACHSRLFAGMAELLSTLRARQVPWGIVTNKPALYTNALVRELALAPAVVVCSDQVSHAKPHPEPVLLACRTLACAPQDAVFVGDDRRDIEAGRAAGAATVAIAYGYGSAADPPHRWGADHLVATPSALALLL